MWRLGGRKGVRVPTRHLVLPEGLGDNSLQAVFSIFFFFFLNNFFGGWEGNDQTYTLSLMTWQHRPKNRGLLLFLVNEVFPIPKTKSYGISDFVS